MPNTCPELLIVMPVFNEQESIQRVVTEWFAEMDRIVSNYVLLAIDDGSVDDTLAILHKLHLQIGDRLEIISRENRGHGQTCLQGYHIAAERGIPFIFQIDSDGQSDPRYFGQFWALRDQYDVIYGKRTRQDGLRRILASFTLRCSLRILAQADCVDANVPYRLMNHRACQSGIPFIPNDLSLANIGLAVILRKTPSIRHGAIPIGFPPRLGGEPSVRFLQFATKAIELFRQLKKAGIT